MPSKERNLDAALEKFLDTRRKKRRAEQTIKGYSWIIGKVNRALTEGGYEAHPIRWTEQTVNFLLDDLYSESQSGVARREFSVLNCYLQIHGNNIISNMDLEWAEDGRIHVHWLTPQQAREIEREAKGMERIVIHLELRIGLRRVEVLRLRMQDIQTGHFNILGKGRRGGKWRQNPFDPGTLAELDYFLKLRDLEIAKAQSKNPGVKIPDALLIYERAGELHPYKRTAIDELVKAVSERTGIPCTNHVLRRQFAKELRLSGVPIETISELLGHKDLKTTRLYLGIDMDDKSNAMVQAAQFRAAAEAAFFERASIKSGQSGI
jgi:integrase